MKKAKLTRSRDAWKHSAKHRTAQIAHLKKSIRRKNRQIEKANAQCANYQNLLRENAELRAFATQLRNSRPPPRLSHRTLCVAILLAAIVPFRAVPRILKTFQAMLHLPLSIPHFTSVIHWTLRAGVAVFSQVAPLADPWVALLDTSINIGTRKALVVLRVPLAALQKKGRALGLEDCQCVGMEISSTWNGTRISEALERIFAVSGAPTALLKDGGADLKKGVQLYTQRHPGHPVVTVDDAGHYAANLLKARFGKARPFMRFLAIASRGASRIRQTDLAWLLPPKIRSKGRFMAITNLANWAQRMLHFLQPGHAGQVPPEAAALRTAFAGLRGLRPFLAEFCQSSDVVEGFLKLLKTQGLNDATAQDARALLAQLPTGSALRKGLTHWLDKHLAVFKTLLLPQISLPVSSDPIESLFGKFKTIVQRNPYAEINRLIFVIPLLCGSHSTADIERALKQCSHAQMRSRVAQVVPQTLRQIRTQKLKQRDAASVPKTRDNSGKKSKRISTA